MKASKLKELMENDPEYITKRNRQNNHMNHLEEEIKKIELPFINELHTNGYTQINSTSDLLNLKKADAQLVNLLLAWIPRINNKHNSQEMLIRALAVAKEPFDSTPLTTLFDKENSFGLKWAIANTIASTEVLNVTTWLDKTLSTDQLAKESEMLIYAVIRYYSYEKASHILKRLFHQFPLQAADAFAKIGKRADIEYLEKVSIAYKGIQLTSIKKAIKKLKAKYH